MVRGLRQTANACYGYTHRRHQLPYRPTQLLQKLALANGLMPLKVTNLGQLTPFSLKTMMQPLATSVVQVLHNYLHHAAVVAPMQPI